MATPSENRPGVVVEQQIAQTPTLVSAPTLVPMVVGPCKQIVETLNTSGGLNADAKYAKSNYNQRALFIPKADFPDPRSNMDELIIDGTTVEASLNFGGSLRSIPRGSNGTFGSSFLNTTLGITGHPAILSALTEPFSFDPTVGDALVLAFDATNPLDVSKDFSVILKDTLTAQDVADAVNAAAGQTVARAYDAGGGNVYVMFYSTKASAAGSVTLRAGASALKLLFGAGFDDSQDYRVTGAGFRAQDDLDSDLTSPWIEFTGGEYLEGVSGTWTATTFPGATPVNAIWAAIITLDPETGIASLDSFTSGPAAVGLDFTDTSSSNPIPLKAATASVAGDTFWFDGQNLQSNEVIRLEPTRFKLGKLNVGRSTFDDNGVATSRVYDQIEVNLIVHPAPFAPTFTWIKAQGLVFPGDGTGVAASITGDTQATAAKAAIIQSDEITFGGGLAVAGLTLLLTVTEDDVALDQATVTLVGGPFANATALAVGVNTALTTAGLNTKVSATSSGNRLVFETAKTGAGQALALSASGTANSALEFSTVAATTSTGIDPEFADPAVVTGSALTFPLTTGSLTYELLIIDNYGTHTLTETVNLGGGTVANMTALITALSTAFGGGVGGEIYDGYVHVATLSDDGAGALIVTTTDVGADVSIDLTAGVGDGFTLLGFTDGVDAEADGVDGLKGTQLLMQFDVNPSVFAADFTTNSLSDAVDEINSAVSGDAPVAEATALREIKISSTLLGVASRVEADTSSSAAPVFGFTVLLNNFSDTGSGRPLPDFYLDNNGSAHVGAQILRDRLTGIPYSLSSAIAGLYVAYEALRLDVSSAAASPDILTFESTTDLEAGIGPISPRNPLALGMFLAKINCPGFGVSGLGLDETDAAAPEGTVDAWARALELLESKEIYGIAALQREPAINTLIMGHVLAMSEPLARGERIALLWQDSPTRAAPLTVTSGVGAETNGINNSLTLDENPADELIGLGFNVTLPLPVSSGVYLEALITESGSTRLVRYSIQDVSGVAVTFRTSFATGENDDGFYTTLTLDGMSNLTGIDWTIKVRGAPLVITGTSIPNLGGIMQAAADEANAYGSRRVYLAYADSVDVPLNGITQNVPPYYAMAAIAGLVGSRNPSLPLTQVALGGLSKVYGTDDRFSEAQLDVASDGGRLVLVNSGATVVPRASWSTNPNSIESRELSITTQIDSLAKGARLLNRRFIGGRVITPNLLDEIATANQSYAQYASNNIVNYAEVDSILQDETQLDRILITYNVSPAYPANRIKVTFVI